jgi:hypothetical protein
MVTKKETYEPLFTSDSVDENNARINQSAVYGLDLFAGSYKTAADTLVNSVLEHSADHDTLVYPIVFLYRHYLELRLKEIIREGSLLLYEERDFPKIHDLGELWLPVKSIIERVWAHEDSDDSSDLGLVDDVLTEFVAIDPKSMSFRYPGLLAGVEQINLRHLSQTMERVFFLLDGVSDAICAFRDFENEVIDY